MVNTGKSTTRNLSDKPTKKGRKASKKHNTSKTLSPSKEKKTAKRKRERLSKEEFLQLQQTWYDKLAESGFQDVERKNKNYMRRESTNIALSYSKDTEDYYIRCRHFCFSEPFQELSTLEQDVWSLHSEGYSYDQILNTLNKSNNLTMLLKKKPFSRTKIQRIIHRIKQLMLVTPYG